MLSACRRRRRSETQAVRMRIKCVNLTLEPTEKEGGKKRSWEVMSTFDLFSAVRDGNAEVVHRLLQTRHFRARLNSRNEWGDTALHLAAEAGNTEICHMLKAAGASVTVRNNRGETCLHRSSVSGHVEACRAIVGQGQDPEVVNSTNDAGYTALHHAARHGSRELIEILLNANADRMIENNAGETPYMVAQRSQQYEAERLLLNVEQQHADQAISEMNRKEKDIIRAYLKALRYASHLESRVRIVLVGDTGTGKSTLKKTIYGEYYDPKYKPTLGIDADPSITRIMFKQYKEWILQNASKADARRLNLEYIDIIIDYVLNALLQPQVCDDAFDVGTLQIEKDQLPKVDFNPSDTVIPEGSAFENDSDEEEGEEGGMEQEDHANEEGRGGKGSFTATMPVFSNASGGKLVGLADGESASKGGACEGAVNSDVHRSAQPTAGTTSATPSSTLSRRVSTSDKVGSILQEHRADDSIFCTKGKLSRLLVENVPREILKRMVIRWPVGDEPLVVSRAELNKQRLMITVWDVSGDPLQHNFTPFFFSHRCLFVSMYNLTRDLDGPCNSFAAKNLFDLDGHVPTNAEALEDWLGYVSAFSKPMPSVPFRCNDTTPVLPPVIVACSFADKEEVRERPVSFHNFFGRESFSSYQKHLVEGSTPSAVMVSSKYEDDGEESYAGHHLLRREIDHLARQMPFCTDSVPIQWVKFEQLICSLQEQKKIIVLYDDITKYIVEHCKVSGILQILPILSHFHDVGVVSYFYRHPLLSNVVITKPQWLADALSAIIIASPGKWVTAEVEVAFEKLSQEGVIAKDMLLLAYRCGRMHQRYWNEMLFILNCMDLICCHPVCHEVKSLFVPCLVTQPIPKPGTRIVNPSSSSSSMALHFSSGTAAFPIAMYNQFVVRCIRSCRYAPKLFYCTAHLRLNSSHHLIVSKHRTSVSIQVLRNHEQNCRPCLEVDGTQYPISPMCAHIKHIIGEEAEYSPSDNIATLITLSTKLKPTSEPTLPLQDDRSSFSQLCPSVLAFTKHHLNFLTKCWFPGLRLEMLACDNGSWTVLDQYWQHTVLRTGTVSPSLSVWFK